MTLNYYFLIGSMNNGLPSSLPSCSMVHVPLETENTNSDTSKSSTSMIVYGIDVYENDIATLASWNNGQ